MRQSTATLSLTALILLMGASQVYADTGGVVDATQVTASGTITDTTRPYFAQTTVGVITSIIDITCGTITGTIQGTYCDYETTSINQATGAGTYSTLEVCKCNGTAPNGGFIAVQTGTLSVLGTHEDISATETIISSHHSTIKAGNLVITGAIDVKNLLMTATYTGALITG